jgi:hypothetical protein
MDDKRKNAVIILLIALLLWFIYLSDYEMSRYGIYTIFSYNVHEVLGLIPLLSIFITTIWILLTIAKSIKEKGKKFNPGLGLIILALCVIQILFIKNQYQTRNTTCVTSVKSIQESKMEITINQNGTDIALDCPMLVLYMIKADGTEYGITYEWNKSDPEHGKLCMIQAID